MRRLGLSALLLALPAFAQRVAILELDGGDRLRDQVEEEVRRVGTLEVVSRAAYLGAAAEGGLAGAEAFTPAGVARLGEGLRLDAAVGGEVLGSTWRVVILDRVGQPLWRRALPLERGLLTPELAARLARAIAVAADQGARAAPPDPPGPVPEAPASPGPALLRGWLGGTTTWRTQCLRPGVSSCRAFEQQSPRPAGVSVTFSPAAPYLGLSLHGELFPLARRPQRWLNGLGLVGEAALGIARTQVVEQTSQGSGATVTTSPLDLEWAVAVAWRVHFQIGHGAPQAAGFAGVRAGVRSRSFLVDATSSRVLPSSQRVGPLGFGFPELGLEASVPISPYFRIELGGSVLVSPRPAPAQVRPYGDPAAAGGGVSSSGFAVEGGFSGLAWGPLGWAVRLRSVQLLDLYAGRGLVWTACTGGRCGGVGEESYTAVTWGLTARW